MKLQFFFRLLACATFATWLSASAGAAEVFLRVGPPRPVIERSIGRPSPAHVWIAGYYRWSGHAYVWVPGRWALPPRTAAVWVAPHWDYVPARRSYVFVAGFWR